VPPIEKFTNSTPSAPYLSHSGISSRNTSGASISAASVMAAGSVISEPLSGTSAMPNQTSASSVRMGSRRARPPSRLCTTASTGREAATTITLNTNSGSVYWRDSA